MVEFPSCSRDPDLAVECQFRADYAQYIIEPI